eukprot:UC4_evm1s1340
MKLVRRRHGVVIQSLEGFSLWNVHNRMEWKKHLPKTTKELAMFYHPLKWSKVDASKASQDMVCAFSYGCSLKKYTALQSAMRKLRPVLSCMSTIFSPRGGAPQWYVSQGSLIHALRWGGPAPCWTTETEDDDFDTFAFYDGKPETLTQNAQDLHRCFASHYKEGSFTWGVHRGIPSYYMLHHKESTWAKGDVDGHEPFYAGYEVHFLTRVGDLFQPAQDSQKRLIFYRHVKDPVKGLPGDDWGEIIVMGVPLDFTFLLFGTAGDFNVTISTYLIGRTDALQNGGKVGFYKPNNVKDGEYQEFSLEDLEKVQNLTVSERENQFISRNNPQQTTSIPTNDRANTDQSKGGTSDSNIGATLMVIILVGGLVIMSVIAVLGVRYKMRKKQKVRPSD